MWLRTYLVLAVAVLFAVVQMFAAATGGPRASSIDSLADMVGSSFTQRAAAADDNADNSDGGDNSSDNSDSADNADNSDSGDNGDSADNSDSSDNSDNSDSADNGDSADNADDSADNAADDDSGDNSGDGLADATATPTASTSTASAPSAVATPTFTTSTASAPVPPPSLTGAVPSPSPQPTTEVSGVTNGTDMLLALSGDRVTVQAFSTLQPGYTITLRMVDPLAYAATPGIRAGDLIFQVDVKDPTGAVVTSLPAEVNLAVHYSELDVTGLNEANVTLGHLDPTSQQWAAAPKMVTDPTTNFVAGSITDTGVYAVYIP